jgi:bifunctional DNA-binding transcriptional regulator/antitoxin component of YhaV-PrlF toxin-antitoxin module
MENYKKYSLENLENWLHDAMSADGATPQEIYGTIRKVVEENYYFYKHQTSKAYELLALLNGNGKGHIKEYDDCVDRIFSCDKDDQSPERKGAWDSFWTHDDVLIQREYYQKKDKVFKWRLPVELDGPSGEYYIILPDDLLEAANLKEGDQIEWIDNSNGSFILKKCESDTHKELPNHSQSINNDYKTYEEAVKNGWTMTADGFWIKNS